MLGEGGIATVAEQTFMDESWISSLTRWEERNNFDRVAD
jgi:hypothetical protein